MNLANYYYAYREIVTAQQQDVEPGMWCCWCGQEGVAIIGGKPVCADCLDTRGRKGKVSRKFRKSDENDD